MTPATTPAGVRDVTGLRRGVSPYAAGDRWVTEARRRTADERNGKVLRSRRSCLATPGSNPRFLAKAKGLDADQVFLDLEDSVAPIAKVDARKNIVAALNEGGWGTKIRVVRVNDWTTEWTYADVIEVVSGAGANLDCIMLPKVQTAEQVVALDLLLTQLEKVHGYEPGRIGIEAQIENALGLTNVNAIARRRRGWRRSSSARPTSWRRST